MIKERKKTHIRVVRPFAAQLVLPITKLPVERYPAFCHDQLAMEFVQI